MAYKITDACIACGACADACPVSAISEGDGKYEIDADTCIECGACADTCPVSAPEPPGHSLPAAGRRLTERSSFSYNFSNLKTGAFQ